MAVAKANTFDGGTAGVSVSAANSGGLSGDAFTSVNAAITYLGTDSYPAAGLSAVNATASLAAATWSALTLTGASLFTRQHIRIAANPASASPILFGFTSASTQVAKVDLSNTGKLVLSYSPSQTQVGITATTVPLETWVRVETEMTTGASPSFKLWLYLDPQATVEDELVSTSAALGASAIAELGFYTPGGITYRMDGVALAESKIGRIVLPQPPFATPIAATAIHRASRW